MPEERLDHERLDVYAAALDFVTEANRLADRLPRSRLGLVDQLLRAASSIALNIAEGAGEFSLKDKARFYRMARRSATECSAVLDVTTRLSYLRDRDVQAGRGLLLRIVAMLTQLARAAENTARATNAPAASRSSTPASRGPTPS